MPESPIELHAEPGHLMRRAHQIAVATFHEVHGRSVTPVQYAVLRALQAEPGIDQVTLAQRVALDTSTTADIATRLDAKGWIVREMLPRRQRSLRLTSAGQAVLNEMLPRVQRGLIEEANFRGAERRRTGPTGAAAAQVCAPEQLRVNPRPHPLHGHVHLA